MSNSKSIQKKGLKRNTIDKFYTKNTVVEQCYNYIRKYITIEKTDIIIEPSAGNGAFIPMIKNLSDEYYFYDIKPEHNEHNKIDTIDYLKFNYEEFIIKQSVFKKKIHINTQDLPRSVIDAGSFYFFNYNNIKKYSSLKDVDYLQPFILPKNNSVDLDDLSDFDDLKFKFKMNN